MNPRILCEMKNAMGIPLRCFSRGAFVFLLYLLNTVILAVPLIGLAVVKPLVRHWTMGRFLDKALMGIASLWIQINCWNTDIFSNIRWDVQGLEDLSREEWYLVISNHQSWVDILVLQKLLTKRIPFLKFFLKKELIWVPFLGIAWWALDFPFMKRYSRKTLQTHPHLKGKDLAMTRKACEKFKQTPVSIMNFVEGTRFTPAKKQKRGSNFVHLLNPKAGGIAFVLEAMNGYLNKIIDVTIVYPGKTPSFWEYISGQVDHVIVDFQLIDITPDMEGDYFNDAEFRKEFYQRLNRLWEEKDRKIQKLLRDKSSYPVSTQE